MVAWISSPSGTKHDGYAQIGYCRDSFAGGVRWFWQIKRDRETAAISKIWNDPLNPPHLGTAYTFSVRASTSGSLHLYINGACYPDGTTSLCTETSFPLLAAADHGIMAEWLGETKHRGDDVPGTASNTADFSTVEVMDENFSWSSQVFDNPKIEYCPYYHVNEFTSDSHFEIWTQPLDHSNGPC